MVVIQGQIRKIKGSKVKRLRKKGLLPAVVYGPGIRPLAITVSHQEFLPVFRQVGESQMIDLEIQGKKRPVLIHDVAREPLRDEVIHIDFYQVARGKKVTSSIPLEFEGDSPAVREKNGVLVINLREVPVRGLPQDFPPKIKVDLSGLKDLHQEILVSHLDIPDNIKVLAEPSLVVASVIPPRTKTEEAEALAEKEVPTPEETPVPEQGKAEEGSRQEEPTAEPS